jgi:hypothetical protein
MRLAWYRANGLGGAPRLFSEFEIYAGFSNSRVAFFRNVVDPVARKRLQSGWRCGLPAEGTSKRQAIACRIVARRVYKYGRGATASDWGIA